MDSIKIHHSRSRDVARKLLDVGSIRINYENPFTWSSGWKSPIYCDNRLSLSYPKVRTYIKNALAEAIGEHFKEVEYIAGVATAGIPQGALVADVLDLPYVYVRQKPKTHGTRHQIEGNVEQGKNIVLIEDLISTGRSALSVAEILRKAGFNVVGVVAVFTYGFGVAEDQFSKDGIPLVCLTNLDCLLSVAVNSNILNADQVSGISLWKSDPTKWM